MKRSFTILKRHSLKCLNERIILMKMKNALKIVVGIALIAMLFSCSTFTETTSKKTAEMSSFEDVVLDKISMSDLKKLGTVKASRTLTYVLQENGDFTVEMDDYSYVYTKKDDSFVQTGTRYSGALKAAPIVTAGGSSDMVVVGGADFLGSLFGAMGAADAPAAPSSISVKDVAFEAVTYDLVQAATAKGGVALLLPEYTWEINEEVTGSRITLPFYASTTYKTKTTTYIVTATAAAVSF